MGIRLSFCWVLGWLGAWGACVADLRAIPEFIRPRRTHPGLTHPRRREHTDILLSDERPQF